MTEADHQFRDDQVSGTRVMYCECVVDKCWLATVDRRRKTAECLSMARENDSIHQTKLFTKMAMTEDTDAGDQAETTRNTMDEDFASEESGPEELVKTTIKRRRCEEREKMTLKFDEMPKDCQHIRHSIKHVRTECYKTVDELMSVFHMSYKH